MLTHGRSDRERANETTRENKTETYGGKMWIDWTMKCECHDGGEGCWRSTTHR